MAATRWVVYVLRCRTGELYTGVTTDVERRLDQHNRGVGAKFTRGRRPVTLVHIERAGSHSDALKRERAIKAMSRAEKESMLSPVGGPVSSRS